MKILTVIHDFLPRHQAGSELYCFYLCQELRRRGHDVRILCTEIDQQEPVYTVRERTYEGLPIAEIVQHFHFWRFEETYRNPAIEKIFANVLGSWTPDVVHFHHLLGLSFECPRLARASGAAVVFTLHDYWLLCLRGGGQCFLDDGTVCHIIDPEVCSKCVAEFGLLNRRASRWVKQLLVRSSPHGELNLLDELKRARIKAAKRSFVRPMHTAIDDIERQAILAHPPAGITYHLPLTTESCLLFSYAMVPSTYAKPGEGVLFRVKLNDSLLWERYLDAKHKEEDRGWHSQSLDIPAVAGRGKLTLETHPGPSGDRDFCAAVWGNPRVILNVGATTNEQTPVSQAKSLGRTFLHRLFGRRHREEAHRRIAAARSVAESVERFICPSPFLRKTFADHGFPEDKLIVSDYGISSPAPLPLSSPAPLPLRFTYMGSLVRHKGVHILVRAFNELDPERAVLRIYGPIDEFVDYVQMLRNLVRNPSIEFRGRFENREVSRILGETDVLVVPSIWFENSPITIHEAFLAEVPVITARFGGMADLVADEVNGLLFEVGNVQDLRRVLLRFLEDPGLVVRLRPDPSSVKSMEENAEEMEQLYQSLLTGERKVITDGCHA